MSAALLLDKALVKAKDGVEREVQPGEKVPFVLEPDADKPWEYRGSGLSRRIYLYGTVLHDWGKFRTWYFCRMGATLALYRRQLSDFRPRHTTHRREALLMQRSHRR